MTPDEPAATDELPDLEALEAELAALEGREASLRGELAILSTRLALQRKSTPYVARYSSFDLVLFGLVASLPIVGTVLAVILGLFAW